MSREDAELATRFSDTAFPEGASAAQSPVQPGQEREFIETLKQLFGKLDATPGARELCRPNSRSGPSRTEP